MGVGNIGSRPANEAPQGEQQTGGWTRVRATEEPSQEQPAAPERVPLGRPVGDWPEISDSTDGEPTQRASASVRAAVLDAPDAHRRSRRLIVARQRRAHLRTRHASTLSYLSWGGTLLLAVLIVATVAASASAIATFYQTELPLVQSMGQQIAAHDSVRIYARDGTLLYQLNNDGAQHSIPLAEIPVTVVNATVATEDHDFWTNQGVDFQAIARAAYTDATSGHIQEGASTITQQLIKLNVLNSNITFTRKLKEAILSLGLTYQGVYTKSQLLQMYLNSIPYGPTVYGIDAAATAYFSYQDNPATGETAAQHLDLAQASLLAGLPQSPAYNDPLASAAGFTHARARQRIVLDSMVQYGYITREQASAAWAEAGKSGFFHPQYTEPDLAPAFVDYVQQLLDTMVTTHQIGNIARTGLNVYTTLDLNLQDQVQQNMYNHLCGNDLNDYPGSAYYGQRYIREDNVSNSAAVLVHHSTGGIRVLLGSMDYYGTKTCHKGVNGQFNVATQGFRGPGSSFKPIVYATAFQKGWFPAMTVGNEPTAFWDAQAGTLYKPLNADSNHLATAMTLRNALQLSQNIPAVKVMQFAGIQNVQQNAERWGITSWLGTWGLSSVLGTLDVHLIDMVQAYTVFANYGRFIPLHAINRITDASGNALFQYHVPQGVQVLDPRVAYMITSILSDNPAREPEFNVCSPLYLDASQSDCYAYHGNSPNVWPAAAKTGTGQNLTNDWTMGYTMDYTMGVWAGNNDHSSMQWVDGVTGAAPIWYHSMLDAEQNLPKRAFPVPTGMHRAAYSTNGITSTDWFLNGEAPGPSLGGMSSKVCVTYHHNNFADRWDYC